jgi:hypothetical protein
MSFILSWRRVALACALLMAAAEAGRVSLTRSDPLSGRTLGVSSI